jgi:hypothetical protein
MRRIPTLLALAVLFAAPAIAQKRSAPKKEVTFPEAVEQAKKSVDAQEYGAAVTALQAAIRAVQKVQRTAILAALPKPEGFTIKDDDVKDDEANPFGGGMAALGLTLNRHYSKDGKRIDVEVTANSPLVQMLSMMFANPAIVKADGGELVEYGQHKAILKPSGDDGHELTILMHGKHIVKVTAQGLTADELLAVFDQATVDRLEKPLGK